MTPPTPATDNTTALADDEFDRDEFDDEFDDECGCGCGSDVHDDDDGRPIVDVPVIARWQM